MDQPGIINFRIEFNLEADPIAGSLHAGDEDGRPFCGWIELTRAIELGLAAARRTQAPSVVVPSEPELTDRQST